MQTVRGVEVTGLPPGLNVGLDFLSSGSPAVAAPEFYRSGAAYSSITLRLVSFSDLMARPDHEGQLLTLV